MCGYVVLVGKFPRVHCVSFRRRCCSMFQCSTPGLAWNTRRPLFQIASQDYSTGTAAVATSGCCHW